MTGRGALRASSASPMQQKSPTLLFGCGFLAGRVPCASWFGTGFRRLLCSISRRPNLSASVSIEVRVFSFAADWCCIVCTWSLCCQQKPSVLPLPLLGLGFGDFERSRLHGFPSRVMPLQIFPLDAGRRDSGVPGMKGIFLI